MLKSSFDKHIRYYTLKDGNRLGVYRAKKNWSWSMNLAFQEMTATDEEGLASDMECCEFSGWTLARIKNEILPQINDWLLKFFRWASENGINLTKIDSDALAATWARELRDEHRERCEYYDEYDN